MNFVDFSCVVFWAQNVPTPYLYTANGVQFYHYNCTAPLFLLSNRLFPSVSFTYPTIIVMAPLTSMHASL